MSDRDLARLLQELESCSLCATSLPNAPRPVLQVHPQAKVLIAAQAPGRHAHAHALPFADQSGDRLRDWLGVSREEFYDSHLFALLPMGFCYPGKGRSGDLPPRPECASRWRASLLAQLRQVQLTLVIGQYARRYHLPDSPGSLQQLVRNWRHYAPSVFPLPHPSPRNILWLRRNPWFAEEVLPALRERVAEVLRS
ncbi:uracil-DNA glycosylase family protein [Acidithiobacillus sp. CV18-2]|uniref:Uracil-DNA glycosylase family protein n=1 Tax=Igneacidithiobacillus copahuensis TaxID=2724909 RepID=A0AAE2YMD1_9PROT|nr:uracil-DNA glycosylase family protein [Igneacidithiobacillus copahuensis]MBU2754885.1 uracil-DNA glycosylase family protein [Acidithiobacillus sp. CV18-3]MBU2756567.1 uracil-DNA glycosylase family protein [Acidithiobacillus sp. BN09-2]MBU2777181.1 uracil-DNA glycosylase family protein [Acidithiobacillus sp. CV18-2]MBU2796098.1 uracil-DNA glycosylase family protein [Acidithiobacillus sp. VAN18-2]MBU2800006.1 uracil-DNA glycosylase family protein [Acidithiobacillus sp. VAN18-4]UTV80370.1 ura